MQRYRGESHTLFPPCVLHGGGLLLLIACDVGNILKCHNVMRFDQLLLPFLVGRQHLAPPESAGGTGHPDWPIVRDSICRDCLKPCMTRVY